MRLPLSATFENTDDLLWDAAAGRLASRAAMTVGRSGQIGPLVELAWGARTMPDAFHSVTITAPFFAWLTDALDSGRISGAGSGDVAGIFPMSKFNPEEGNALWDQWASHAANAAERGGLSRGLVNGLMGVIGELQENVYQHSGRPESGIVAYAVNESAFEFVVADAGIGVLASLRQNPEFTGLKDSEAALRVALSDGASRHGHDAGRGYGIGNLFRALAHDAGDLRFRSGDHMLRITGDAPSLVGQVQPALKAWLDGLIITVRCTARGR